MICRLCLQDKSNALDIFAGTGQELGMAEIIAKYFWFEPQRDDPISKFVCGDCWKKVTDFHEFYQFVEEANRQNLLLSAQCVVSIKKEDDEHASASEKMRSNHILQQSSFEVDLKLPEDFQDVGDENLIDMPPVHVEFVEGNDALKGEEFLEAAKDKQTMCESSRNCLGDFPDECLMDEPLHSDSSDLSEDEKADALDASKSDGTDNMNASDAEITNTKTTGNKFIVTESNKEDGSDNDDNQYDDDDAPLSQMKALKKSGFSRSSRTRTSRTRAGRSVQASAGHKAASDSSNLNETNAGSNEGCGNSNGEKSKSVENKTSDRKSADFKEKTRQIDDLIAQYVRLNCDICGIVQKTFSNLINHMKAEHQIEKGGYVMCCNKRFHKRHRLFEHVQTHINPDSYKCNECGKTFNDKPCLRNHILNKHQPEEAKIYECEHCSKRFIKAYILERHRLKHEERTHICELCQKGFPTVSLLTAHTKMVHNNYGTMCDICAKVIRGRAAFERHQLEHQGITLPKLQCDICFTWHKDKYGLRKHKSRHNEDGTQHICSFCGKSAPNRIALLKHQRDVHTSQRKFQCSVCDKAFKRAINLREHMTLHTGEVLYSCPHCPRTFNSNANMHSHRKKMHPKEFEETRRLRHEMATKPQEVPASLAASPPPPLPCPADLPATLLPYKTESDILTNSITESGQGPMPNMQAISHHMVMSNPAIAPRNQSL